MQFATTWINFRGFQRQPKLKAWAQTLKGTAKTFYIVLFIQALTDVKASEVVTSY